jgi:hypothetical protein
METEYEMEKILFLLSAHCLITYVALLSFISVRNTAKMK